MRVAPAKSAGINGLTRLIKGGSAEEVKRAMMEKWGRQRDPAKWGVPLVAAAKAGEEKLNVLWEGINSVPELQAARQAAEHAWADALLDVGLSKAPWVLEWLGERGMVPTTIACLVKAAGKGNAKVLAAVLKGGAWEAALRGNAEKWEGVAAAAAMAGSAAGLDALKEAAAANETLRSMGLTPWGKRTVDVALATGAMGTLKWLEEQGQLPENSEEMLRLAACSGSVELFEMLAERAPGWASMAEMCRRADVAEMAARAGNVALLKWLDAVGGVDAARVDWGWAQEVAAVLKDIELLEMAVSKNAGVLTEAAVLRAARAGDVALLKWMEEAQGIAAAVEGIELLAAPRAAGEDAPTAKESSQVWRQYGGKAATIAAHSAAAEDAAVLDMLEEWGWVPTEEDYLQVILAALDGDNRAALSWVNKRAPAEVWREAALQMVRGSSPKDYRAVAAVRGVAAVLADAVAADVWESTAADEGAMAWLNEQATAAIQKARYASGQEAEAAQQMHDKIMLAAAREGAVKMLRKQRACWPTTTFWTIVEMLRAAVAEEHASVVQWMRQERMVVVVTIRGKQGMAVETGTGAVVLIDEELAGELEKMDEQARPRVRRTRRAHSARSARSAQWAPHCDCDGDDSDN